MGIRLVHFVSLDEYIKSSTIVVFPNKLPTYSCSTSFISNYRIYVAKIHQKKLKKRQNYNCFISKQGVHLPTLPKKSNVVIQLFVHPPRPLVEHLMRIIHTRIEMLQPTDEPWVDTGIFLPSRTLLSHLVFLLIDEGHDLRQGYPVRVQQNDDLVVGVDELLK